MRPVGLADIDAVVRVLAACPVDERVACLRDIYHAADVADRYRKRLGKPHPRFGSGTLMSAAASRPMAPREAQMSDKYLTCMALLANHLLWQRGHQLP